MFPACAVKQLPPQTAKPWIPRKPLHSLSGFADVDIKSGGRSESFQAALLAERPNRLRIQILDDLGREQALLVANGHQVLWLNRREGIKKILAQDPEVLKKTLRLPVGLEEFIARLLGGNSPTPNPNSKSPYQIYTEELEETSEGPYPKQWTWNFRRPKATLSFLFSQVKLNPRLDADKFDF
jgi:outer membrane lipoprotein-sorting protein